MTRGPTYRVEGDLDGEISVVMDGVDGQPVSEFTAQRGQPDTLSDGDRWHDGEQMYGIEDGDQRVLVDLTIAAELFDLGGNE